MAEDRLYQKPKGLTGGLKARLSSSLHDPEQVFEWNKVTRRRIFRNMCNLPFAMVDWKITNRDLPFFPPSVGKAEDGTDNYAGLIRSNIFTGQIVKLFGDAALKFGMSNFVKTMVMGYNKKEDYRRVSAMSNELLALSFTARHHDPEARARAEEIQKNKDAPLYQLFTQAKFANDVMTRFAKGELDMTEENISTLAGSLSAISQLCEQKAGIPKQANTGTADNAKIQQLEQDLQSQTGQALLHHTPEQVMPELYRAHGKTRPSQHIRDALEAKTIDRLDHAQTYLATLSCLITDGSFGIATDTYRHKDELFLDPKACVQATKDMEEVLSAHGLRINADEGGQPLNPQLSPNVMVQEKGGNYAVADADTVIAATNAMKAKLKGLEKKLDRMLAYADAHYAEVDGMLAADRLMLEDEREAENMQAEVVESWAAKAAPAKSQSKWKALAGKNNTNNAMYDTMKPGLAYTVRPQARHEMWKLYSRDFPTYALQLPINVITRTLIGDVKHKDELPDVPSWVPGGIAKKLYQNFQGSIPSAKNLQSSAWQLATIPAVGSYPAVAGYEATRLDKYDTLERSKKMNDFLGAATIAAYEADSSFAKKFDQAAANERFAALAEQYADVLATPEESRTEEDYRDLGAYFAELAQISEAMFADAYAPFCNEGKADFANFKESTTRAFTEGAKTTADALKVLHLLRFVRDLADEQILSMEYVFEDDIVVTESALRQITDTVMDATQEAGFAIEGMQYTDENGSPQVVHSASGAKSGQLLKQDANGDFRPASADELIAYTNRIIEAVRDKQGIGLPKLLEVTQGRLSDTYMRKVEAALMEGVALPEIPSLTPKVKQAAQTVQTPANEEEKLQKRPDKRNVWQQAKAHFLRPELLHEMRLRRDRFGFVAIFGLPVKMMEGVLRGDVQNVFTAANVKSSTFHGLASAFFGASYGALGLREIFTFKGQRAVDEAKDASGVLGAAITSAGLNDAGLRKRFAAMTGSNPMLGAMEDNPAFYALPGILAKPALERSPEEQQLFDDFYQSTAGSVIEGAVCGLHSETKAPSEQDIPAALFAKEATNAEEAVQLLAGVDALLKVESDFVNVLRYEGMKGHLLSASQLGELADYINDKSYTMGLNAENLGDVPKQTLSQNGKPVEADTLVQFANAVGRKAQALVEAKQQKFADKPELKRYLDARDSAVARNI